MDNLKYNIEQGTISHPLFTDIVEYIPIIIQTEGIFHESFGVNTDTFRVILANLKKYHEDGDLMKRFEEGK